MRCPIDLWGLIYHDWKPTPEEGVTVFLQGLEKRGDNNLRKRIYFSGVTPDLYKPMYGAKVAAFFDKVLDQQFANKPFMRHYLDYYFDIYWDLHLGVTGDAFHSKCGRSARHSTRFLPTEIRCCRSRTTIT